ncbi:MAG: cobyric acid synthase [Hyphomicrobiales bacterium]|nr:cobyric acid synthase [Hyphomicrobiales bacterium]
MTKSLMLQGTGSNVGKSVLVAGLCRLAKNRGLRVMPFKPQNMSNNAAVALCGDGSGGEIGRAQWLQALACGVPPHVDMNPVLLKPQTETGSQIIVQGKIYGSAGGREYQSLRQELLEPVLDSFERIKKQTDLVLVEGAGSPAEINLRRHDIANMGFALAGDVPVALVGDIDRGGVIASLVGTHTILDKKDREQIKGFLINKFRGDVTLFDEGREQIRSFTNWKDFGVLPWLDAVANLPEEDSVWFDNHLFGNETENQQGTIKIVVPVFSRIANFDDLDPLKGEEDVQLIFLQRGQNIPEDADMIVLAGSKSTISDMAEMERNGWASQIRRFANGGGQIIGICGGYQMLGTKIFDPQNIEGNISEISALGLLDIKTVLSGGKTVRVSEAISKEYDVVLGGYEIHLGESNGPDCNQAMMELGQAPHGACSGDGRIRGCYLHGLFSNDDYRVHVIRSLGGNSSGINYLHGVETALDALANEMDRHLDIDGLLDM